MGSGGVAIAALPTVICLKVPFSDGLGGVSKFTPSFKISQSPNFHKLGLCYSIIFLYLYGKKFLICQRYNLFPI